jgi:4-diphosphocytidyl-2-C-methyl-D-erythritol kinase
VIPRLDRRESGSDSNGDAARKVRVRAPAKINLFLHVGDKRSDGYHALESLIVFAETSDHIEIGPGSDLKLKITGPFGKALSRESDNLVLKAARALQTKYPHEGQGAHIALEKNLPLASGIGGGSADAAATLRGLNGFWRLELPEDELLDIAAEIGSDVPACLLSSPCWMEGRGERVSKLGAMPPFELVLVNPGVAVPTGPVFAALNARTGIGAMARPPVLASVWELVAYLADAGNDLEGPAGRFAPVIEDVLAALGHEPACVLAQMSGSGATCFGLFDGSVYAAGAAERIAEEHPHWWVKSTRIAAPGIGAPQWSSTA